MTMDMIVFWHSRFGFGEAVIGKQEQEWALDSAGGREA